MKQILAALLIGFMITGGSNLFAQSKTQTSNELDAIADKILQANDEHRKSQYIATARLDQLEITLNKNKSASEKLKQDLRKLKSRLQEAQGTGTESVTVGRTEVSTERFREFGKHKIDELRELEQENSTSSKIAQDCKNAILDFKKAHSEALTNAKEFKATMEGYRRTLSRQLVQLQFAKSKLDSQFEFARKNKTNKFSISYEKKIEAGEFEDEDLAAVTRPHADATPLPRSTAKQPGEVRRLEDLVQSQQQMIEELRSRLSNLESSKTEFDEEFAIEPQPAVEKDQPLLILK